MANTILAILEQREGKLKKSSFEVTSTAAKLGKDLGLDVQTVVVGNEIDGLNEISKYGVSKISHLKNADLENYSPNAYTNGIADLAKEVSAEYLIFSNTALGKDLSPRVAVKLNAGCLVDCINLEAKDGSVVATRPIYAGKALMDVKPKSEVKVITLRTNVFPAEESQSPGEANIQVKNIDSPDLSTKVVEFKKSEGKLDVAEADIIVSGGRGLKAPENFKLVEDLADALGAAVGASRAAVDAGWRPHREQVGQTGKTVTPSLYIACGISGAIQHLAGMSSSKYIVAINKDKDAPIFGVADYGIAGDVFEVLPALTEEIKKLKS
ncbi:MAG TPA: electron transfer flavoprotein subunit alpha/FixB family protein [Ignavibacteriaceae bacterium]|nr:electron transfer flavoprotein subunit alpha/FixB family protein [Ignavibacteriaceae bacterium]